jgi:hypothetical protein
MGIDLGGSDAGMAEQPLHEANVNPILQQERCCSVTEHVRCNTLHHTGAMSEGVEPQSETLRRETPATLVLENELILSGRRDLLDLFGQSSPNAAVGDIDNPFSGSFAEYTNTTGSGVNVTYAQRTKLGYP